MLGANITHMTKDGDATSLGEAMAGKLDAMTASGKVDAFPTKTSQMLCGRHNGKNAAKAVGKIWSKSWGLPKSKVGNCLRGFANRAVEKHAGDGTAMRTAINALPLHITGDHSRCPITHGCRGPPGTHKQTPLTSNKAVIPKLQGVIDHHCSDENCQQLQFNVTTNPVESHNGELICLCAKREFSADGARCDNYACLVALRRAHGRHADLMLMEMMGFPVTEAMIQAIDVMAKEALINKMKQLKRSDRRRELRSNRIGWDKKQTESDEKAGRSYKSKKRKKKNDGNKKKATKRSKRSKGGSNGTELELEEDEINTEPKDDSHSDFDEADFSDEGCENGIFGPAMTEQELRDFVAMQARAEQLNARAKRAARR